MAEPRQRKKLEPDEMAVVERLLSEFSDELRTSPGLEVPAFDDFVRRCPEGARSELRALLNTLVLADRALAPLADLDADADPS